MVVVVVDRNLPDTARKGDRQSAAGIVRAGKDVATAGRRPVTALPDVQNCIRQRFEFGVEDRAPARHQQDHRTADCGDFAQQFELFAGQGDVGVTAILAGAARAFSEGEDHQIRLFRRLDRFGELFR